MPDDSKTAASPKKSIRQTLNLASVGKAFADVMNKDNREATRNAKKTKESSRRSSIVNPIPAPRASMSDRPPSQVSRRTATPDSKTVTRKRVSASFQRSSSDEQPPKLADSASPHLTASRTSTLRPRNLNATSALPKYRPKSVLVEVSKPPSPVRAGTRRRFSNSDDEKKEQHRPSPSVVSLAEKIDRPISPLPQRAALKPNLTNSVNATPPSTPSRTKMVIPSPNKSSPSRPAKIIKTAGTTSIPRPPSSNASSASLNVNHTPKSSTPKSTRGPFNSSRSSQDTSKPRTTPSNRSPNLPSRDSPSPLAHRSRKLTTPSLTNGPGNMSHISEGNSDDDDETEDVELLLAPVAALGAPTPAMPRIQMSRKRGIPQTPTRSGLPGRSDLSYLSPQPPGSSEKSSLLRPPQQQSSGARAARGSILSWEQLADEASRTLGEEEIERMLSDMPAPFRSGAVSPSLSSQLDIPESPCLSAIDSPNGYGSISQVLLPDVTPSPAMHNVPLSRFSLSPDASTVDSSTLTMLRLQLAAVESQAKDRLNQMQAMEEEIHNLKQAHTHQMEETEKQMAYMEAQHHQAVEERVSYASSLRDRLQQSEVNHELAVETAVMQCKESILAKVQGRCEAVCSARVAASEWGTVRGVCQVELDVIQGDRATLAVLLAQLDQLRSLL